MTITRYSGSGNTVGKPTNQKYYLYQVPAGKIAKVRFDIYEEVDSNAQNTPVSNTVYDNSYGDNIRIANSLSKQASGGIFQFGIRHIRLLGSYSGTNSYNTTCTFNIQNHPFIQDCLIAVAEGNTIATTNEVLTSNVIFTAEQKYGDVLPIFNLSLVIRKNEFILTEGEGVWIYTNTSTASLIYKYDFTVIEEDL